MTRDSNVWPIVMALAVVTGLIGNMGVLHDAFPAMTKQHEAWLQLAALMLGTVAGKMSMSPLPISSEGRSEAILRNASHAVMANSAASVAAVASDTAAKASAVAVDAAQRAVNESEKASGIADR